MPDPVRQALNGATSHPSAQGYSSANADYAVATFSKVLGNRGLNEIRAGSLVPSSEAGAWSTGRTIRRRPLPASPTARRGSDFNGYSFGNNNTNWPQTLRTAGRVAAEDFTYSFNRAGRHDVKTGGEYLNTFFYLYNCRPCCRHL